MAPPDGTEEDCQPGVPTLPGSASLGSTCTRRCPSTAAAAGFAVGSGHLTSLCLGDGRWVDASGVESVEEGVAGRCESLSCPLVSAPEHGTVTLLHDSRIPGAVVQYTCQPGYYLVLPAEAARPGFEHMHASQAVCLESGHWSALAPTCEPVTCPPLSVAHASSISCHEPIAAGGAEVREVCCCCHVAAFIGGTLVGGVGLTMHSCNAQVLSHVHALPRPQRAGTGVRCIVNSCTADYSGFSLGPTGGAFVCSNGGTWEVEEAGKVPQCTMQTSFTVGEPVTTYDELQSCLDCCRGQANHLTQPPALPPPPEQTGRRTRYLCCQRRLPGHRGAPARGWCPWD